MKMNKPLDFIKQILRGKTLYRVIFNWQVADYCQGLDGKIIDLAAGREPGYYHYGQFKTKPIRVESDPSKDPHLLADLNQPLPLKNSSVDNALFFNALYIIKEPDNLLKEIYRVLKPGGRLFLCSPYAINQAPEPDDWQRLTYQGLDSIIKKAGFINYQIIPFGERFTAAVNLLHPFYLFNLIRLIIYSLALAGDRFLVPAQFRKKLPCPLGYFCVVSKENL